MTIAAQTAVTTAMDAARRSNRIPTRPAPRYTSVRSPSRTVSVTLRLQRTEANVNAVRAVSETSVASSSRVGRRTPTASAAAAASSTGTAAQPQLPGKKPPLAKESPTMLSRQVRPIA